MSAPYVYVVLWAPPKRDFCKTWCYPHCPYTYVNVSAMVLMKKPLQRVSAALTCGVSSVRPHVVFVCGEEFPMENWGWEHSIDLTPEPGAQRGQEPRGSKYPVFKDSGPKNHALHGIFDQGPEL